MVSKSSSTLVTDYSNEVSNEYDSDGELVEVREVDHKKNNKNNSSLNNNNKKLHEASGNTNSLVSVDNVLSDKTNTIVTSRSSNVWQYALRDGNANFATCCLCPDNKRISTNNGSTSTLRRHLILHHNKHELILTSTKRKHTQSTFSEIKKQELHNLIINCIIRDGRTFNDFEKPGAKKLLQELVPGYEIPNRRTVAYRLKRLHAHHYKKLINVLESVDHISITLDFWSNRQKRSFLVITGHYFDFSSYNLNSTVLNFSKFDARHTADEISRILETKLKELNILQKVICVTADGAPNMVRGIEDMNLNLKRVWCIAHRLHLTIINAFGFWISEEKSDANKLTQGNEDMDNAKTDQEEVEMTDIEEFQSNDSMDTDDTQSNDNDPTDLNYDDNEEELLSDVIDEEITDNWSEGIITSDASITYDQELINSVLKKCRALISMIKNSTIITPFFDIERKKQNIKRNLCYDVKTRWNSSFVMIDSLLAVREVLETLFYHKHELNLKSKQVKKLINLELTNDDWMMLSTLHFVLKPFFHATKTMSGRRYPSIGIAFNLLVRLKHFLQRHEKKEGIMLKRLKQLLLSQFEWYFESDHDQLQLIKLHAYFDPAGYAVLTDQEKRSIEQKIKIMVVDDTFKSTEPVITTLSNSPSNSTVPKKPNSHDKTNKTAMDMFEEAIGDSIYEEAATNTSKKATIIDDIYNYRNYATRFNLKHKPSTSSSTLFWQTHGDTFSILGKLAKTMLSVPATSVPSESCFSISSFLGRKERARLSGENLSYSVFLKDKIHF